MDEYIDQYLRETVEIADTVDKAQIARSIEIISELKRGGGRLFILGVGGSAANASHAVNDFRKIAGIEAYAPTDNVSELTARTNDEGWDTVFYKWLETSRFGKDDALLILSVGGGSDTTSLNLVKAIEMAANIGAKIIAIASRDGGCAKEYADACVLIPVTDPMRITPHAEGWQGIIWHLMVNAVMEMLK
ncbi:MAG: SIS domain-containing protein [Oscillospiraceae bacterium]|nr:SIS domain-containing protein [Oscillospiraceae bacterium]